MPLVHFQHGDLFDDPTSPLASFQHSFEGWLADARRTGALARDSSEDAYRHLWSVLTKWCLGQQPPVRLESLTAADLQAFINSRSGAQGPDEELSPRYVWRLLHLVDRVMEHDRRHRGLRKASTSTPASVHATPAAELLQTRPDWQYANASLADPLPDHLSATQARQLVSYLSEARPRTGSRTGVRIWQELRNRASVALQLGAGLSPGDVRAMKVGGAIVAGGRQPGLPWKLRVPADGLSPEREAPLAPWAAQLLRHWLTVRAENGIAGDWLFPSTRSGKPWGKVAQYQSVKLVLSGAGFDSQVVRGGSFRLRHTFALRQLRRGHAPDEVARWLGVTDPTVMMRYQRVLLAPISDVV